MVKIKKVKVDGATVYPATIMQAVKDPSDGKHMGEKLADLASEVNGKISDLSSKLRILEYDFGSYPYGQTISHKIPLMTNTSYTAYVTNDTSSDETYKLIVNLYKEDDVIEKSVYVLGGNIKGKKLVVNTSNETSYMVIAIKGKGGDKTDVIFENLPVNELINSQEFMFDGNVTNIYKDVVVKPLKVYSVAFNKNTDSEYTYKFIINAIDINGTLVKQLYTSGTDVVDLTDEVSFETPENTYYIRVFLKGVSGEKTTAFVREVVASAAGGDSSDLLSKAGIIRVDAREWNYTKYYHITSGWLDKTDKEVVSEISVKEGDRVTVHCKQYQGRTNVMLSDSGYIVILAQASTNNDEVKIQQFTVAHSGVMYINTRVDYIDESYVLIERNTEVVNALVNNAGIDKTYSGLGIFEIDRKYARLAGETIIWTEAKGNGVAVANIKVSKGDVVEFKTTITERMPIVIKDKEEDDGIPTILTIGNSWPEMCVYKLAMPFDGYLSYPCRNDNYFNNDATITISKAKDNSLEGINDQVINVKEFTQYGYIGSKGTWNADSMLSTKISVKKGDKFKAYIKTYNFSHIVVADDNRENVVKVVSAQSSDDYILYEGVVPVDGYLYAPTKIAGGTYDAYVEVTRNGELTTIKEELSYVDVPDIKGDMVSSVEFVGTPITVLEAKIGDDNYPYENIGIYFGNVVKVNDSLFYMYYYGLGTSAITDGEVDETYVVPLFAWSRDGKTFTRGFPNGVEAPISNTNRVELKDADGSRINYGLFSGQVYRVPDYEYPYRFLINSYRRDMPGIRMFKSKDGFSFEFMRRVTYSCADNTLSVCNRGNILHLYGRGYKDGLAGMPPTNRTLLHSYCDFEGNLICTGKVFFGDYVYQASATVLDDRRELLLPTKFGHLDNNDQQQSIEGYIVDGDKIKKLNIDDSPLLDYVDDGGVAKKYPSIYMMNGIFHEADPYYATDKMYMYYMCSEKRHDFTYKDEGKAFFKRIEIKLS